MNKINIGNIAAGYVAAINGLTWEMARMGFDGYQTKVNGKASIESISTRNAEYYGWKMGYNNSNKVEKRDNLFTSIVSLLKSLWNYLF